MKLPNYAAAEAARLAADRAACTLKVGTGLLWALAGVAALTALSALAAWLSPLAASLSAGPAGQTTLLALAVGLLAAVGFLAWRAASSLTRQKAWRAAKGLLLVAGTTALLWAGWFIGLWQALGRGYLAVTGGLANLLPLPAAEPHWSLLYWRVTAPLGLIMLFWALRQKPGSGDRYPSILLALTLLVGCALAPVAYGLANRLFAALGFATNAEPLISALTLLGILTGFLPALIFVLWSIFANDDLQNRRRELGREMVRAAYPTPWDRPEPFMATNEDKVFEQDPRFATQRAELAAAFTEVPWAFWARFGTVYGGTVLALALGYQAALLAVPLGWLVSLALGSAVAVLAVGVTALVAGNLLGCHSLPKVAFTPASPAP